MTNTQNQLCDAILYIPGLGGETLDATALRIASAFDMGAQSAAAEFELEAGQDEDYSLHEDKSLKTKIRTIRRTEPDKDPHKVVDVYEFAYVDSLIADQLEKNVLEKGLRLVLQLAINTPRLIGAFFGNKEQKTFREKLQFISATLLLSLLVVYLVVLSIAVIDTVRQISQIRQKEAMISPLSTSPETAAEGSNITGQTSTNQGQDQRLRISQLFVIIMAVIEVLYPKLKQSFTDAAVEYTSVMEYLGLGTHRQVLGGQLLELIDHIAAQGYRKIHIVAFSFGSIVALDNLFPTELVAAARIREIHTLVTIGCPFDLIRVFWPDYFTKRAIVASAPKLWINVYSPIDIMASNFRNDRDIGEPEPKNAIPLGLTRDPGVRATHAWPVHQESLAILRKSYPLKNDPSTKLIPHMNIVWRVGGPAKKMSLFEFLTLAGLEAHGSYWEAKPESDITAFSPIIEEIYKNDFPLA